MEKGRQLQGVPVAGIGDIGGTAVSDAEETVLATLKTPLGVGA